MMVGGQTLPIENALGASLLQVQCAAEYCHEEGQYLRTTFLSLFLNKRIDYSTHSTYGGRFYCFGHVYGITTHSELTRAISAMCRDLRAY